MLDALTAAPRPWGRCSLPTATAASCSSPAIRRAGTWRWRPRRQCRRRGCPIPPWRRCRGRRAGGIRRRGVLRQRQPRLNRVLADADDELPKGVRQHLFHDDRCLLAHVCHGNRVLDAERDALTVFAKPAAADRAVQQRAADAGVTSFNALFSTISRRRPRPRRRRCSRSASRQATT